MVERIRGITKAKSPHFVLALALAATLAISSPVWNGSAWTSPSPAPARSAAHSAAPSMAHPGTLPGPHSEAHTAASTIALTLGPPTTLRDATHGTDQLARVIPDTTISALGRGSPYGMVTNFVRDPATGIMQLRTGYAPLGGGAFAFDHQLDTTTRDEDDLGIGRPDAIVDPSTGHALFAYILNIRGRHDVLFGQLEAPLTSAPAFTRLWLNRTDIRTPQQLAFARPADIGAPRQLLGFTAFRTDASAGSNVYVARLNPIDLSSQIANVTPAEFRNCTDFRIFHAAIGPVAAARCRRTESTLWRAVMFKLSGTEPWTGGARLVDPVIIGPADDAEDLRVLDAAMDPEGIEITLAWASSAAPASPELQWESRRFDLATWTPAGEVEPFGGDGVLARVSYINLARRGWSEMRAILDVAPDGAIDRGRVSLTGRLYADEAPRQGAAWLEPGAVPDGILTVGPWRPPSPTEVVDERSVPIGLVVYRLEGRLMARRLDASPEGDIPTPITPGTPPPTPTPSDPTPLTPIPLTPTPSTPTPPAPEHFTLWLPALERGAR